MALMTILAGAALVWCMRSECVTDFISVAGWLWGSLCVAILDYYGATQRHGFHIDARPAVTFEGVLDRAHVLLRRTCNRLGLPFFKVLPSPSLNLSLSARAFSLHDLLLGAWASRGLNFLLFFVLARS